jgi:putative tricarboxylic transport membrane protein
MLAKIHPDRIGGLLAAVLGIIVCMESWRIYRISGGGMIGDHTLPALLGGLLFVLGVLLLLWPERYKVAVAARESCQKITACLAAMFAYIFFIFTFGYVTATFCAAAVLFRLFGSYRWGISLGYSAVLTAILYMVFQVGLHIAFPRGVLF